MANYRTSINLDEETSEIVKQMPNRSYFMRECVRRWHAAQATTHIHPTEVPRCYPHSKLGVCPLCWPNGIIGSEDWKHYRVMSREGFDMEKWADERLVARFAWELPPPQARKRKITLWGRLKRIFTK